MSFTGSYTEVRPDKDYRKAKCNFKCRIKVDTSVTCRDTQQPSCVIFDTRNVNLSTKASECSLILTHRCVVLSLMVIFKTCHWQIR